MCAELPLTRKSLQQRLEYKGHGKTSLRKGKNGVEATIMKIDHLHFYVEDAPHWREWLVQSLGFCAVAQAQDDWTQTEILAHDPQAKSPIYFVFSSPLSAASPVAQFLAHHAPGVADVALTVEDCEQVLHKGVRAGATLLQPFLRSQSDQGTLGRGKLQAIGGLTHTLIERQGITPLLPDRLLTAIPPTPPQPSLFQAIDHLVLNVAKGDLQQTAHWYEQTLGFERRQSFSIQTLRSGLYSQVLIHPQSGLRLPINEPSSAQSQIQEFLDLHGGSGIQHVALQTAPITVTIPLLRQRGIDFLEVPDGYYDQIKQCLTSGQLSEREWQLLQQLQILVDVEKAPNQLINSSEKLPFLLQIFTHPIFSQPTFFFEFIERRSQAQGFGEGNFQALFEAIEREQIKRVS